MSWNPFEPRSAVDVEGGRRVCWRQIIVPQSFSGNHVTPADFRDFVASTFSSPQLTVATIYNYSWFPGDWFWLRCAFQAVKGSVCLKASEQSLT